MLSGLSTPVCCAAVTTAPLLIYISPNPPPITSELVPRYPPRYRNGVARRELSGVLLDVIATAEHVNYPVDWRALA